MSDAHVPASIANFCLLLACSLHRQPAQSLPGLPIRSCPPNMTHTLHRLPARSMSGPPRRSHSLLLTHFLQQALQQKGLMQLLLLLLGIVTAGYVTLGLCYMYSQSTALLLSWHKHRTHRAVMQYRTSNTVADHCLEALLCNGQHCIPRIQQGKHVMYPRLSVPKRQRCECLPCAVMAQQSLQAMTGIHWRRPKMSSETSPDAMLLPWATFGYKGSCHISLSA